MSGRWFGFLPLFLNDFLSTSHSPGCDEFIQAPRQGDLLWNLLVSDDSRLFIASVVSQWHVHHEHSSQFASRFQPHKVHSLQRHPRVTVANEGVQVNRYVGPAVDDETVDRDSTVVMVGHDTSCPIVENQSPLSFGVISDNDLHVECKSLWQVKLKDEVRHDQAEC